MIALPDLRGRVFKKAESAYAVSAFFVLKALRINVA